MSTTQEYDEARTHVRARRAFRTHATAFVLVNAMLIAIDALTPGGWWFRWPLFGWSVGLVWHAAVVYGGIGRSDDSDEREIRRYMERHQAG